MGGSKQTKAGPKGYRPCVGVVLFNPDGLVWVGQRADRREPAWQMPQGGIDGDESPRTAAFRELHEEVGVDSAVVLAESSAWHRYRFPPDAKRGKYLGQTQRWFALLHCGGDGSIDLDIHPSPEFSAWRWVALDEAVALIVPFKRPVYQAFAREFSDLPARVRNGEFRNCLPEAR